VRDVAALVNVSTNTVTRLERGEEPRDTRDRRVAGIRTALESAGVIVIASNGDGPGVWLRKEIDDSQSKDGAP
jgi:DNA-binding LacI/PurR family transcriptional regulator